jgi:hypothetical protein
LEFLNTPNSGDVIAYRFYRNPVVLSNANDLTDIPPPFEDILVYDALIFYSGYNPCPVMPSRSGPRNGMPLRKTCRKP